MTHTYIEIHTGVIAKRKPDAPGAADTVDGTPPKIAKIQNSLMQRDDLALDPMAPEILYADKRVHLEQIEGVANREKLCASGRAFLINNCIAANGKGTFNVGYSPTISLTNAKNPSDMKFVSLNFAMTMGGEAGVVKDGEHPVFVGITLRKGQALKSNPSICKLSWDHFEVLVKEGRRVLNFVRKYLLNTSFVKAAEIPMPDHVVVAVHGKRGDQGAFPKVLTLLTVSLMESSNTPTFSGVASLVPLFNVREFYYDEEACRYRPTQRGVTLGLQAFYMLVFPTHQYLVTVHNGIVGIKHAVDALKKSLDDREFYLKNTNQGASSSAEYDMDDLVIEDLLDIESLSGDRVFLHKSGGNLMMDVSADE